MPTPLVEVREALVLLIMRPAAQEEPDLAVVAVAAAAAVAAVEQVVCSAAAAAVVAEFQELVAPAAPEGLVLAAVAAVPIKGEDRLAEAVARALWWWSGNPCPITANAAGFGWHRKAILACAVVFPQPRC